MMCSRGALVVRAAIAAGFSTLLLLGVACGTDSSSAAGPATPEVSCSAGNGGCTCNVSRGGTDACSVATVPPGGICCANDSWAPRRDLGECACASPHGWGCWKDANSSSTACVCGDATFSGGAAVTECTAPPGLKCCSTRSGDDGDKTGLHLFDGAGTNADCICGLYKECSADTVEVPSCTLARIKLACSSVAHEVDVCVATGNASGTSSDAGGGSSSGGTTDCYHPNWESDCTKDSDCDPGLTCAASCASCSKRCLGITCPTAGSCKDTYGGLSKNGRPYCNATCNLGRCGF